MQQNNVKLENTRMIAYFSTFPVKIKGCLDEEKQVVGELTSF